MNCSIAIILFFVIVGSSVCQMQQCLDNEKGFLNANKIVDSVTRQVKKVLIRDGFDPLDLLSFNAPIPKVINFGIGKVELSHCKLYNLSTIHRSKHTESKNVKNTINVRAAVAFDWLKVNCSYKANILMQKMGGNVTVTIPRLSAYADVDFCLSTLQAHLNDIDIHNDERINVQLEGRIPGTLSSGLAETIGNMFQDKILKIVDVAIEGEVRRIMRYSSVYVEVAGERIPILSKEEYIT